MASSGVDVHKLQEAVNRELRHRKLEWRCVKADGDLGPRTLRACAFLAWVIGLSGKRYKAISPDRSYQPHVSETVQRILRDPSKRSALDRAREKARKPKVQKVRKAHSTGPAAAIAYIRKQAEKDVHEVGSTNTGPMVDKWEAFFGFHGLAWCGMLAGYAAIVIGKCLAKRLSFWNGYTLITEAAAGKDGCYEVGFDQIEGGEILVLWGGEHVVTAAGPPVGDSVETGEGNTSPDPGGDQANGGSVEMKTRSRGDVSCAIRIYG
jgi:hypothetical protein